MRVTNFTCILLENQVHSAECVSVSSKIAFLQSIFDAFLVVLGPFWLYEEFGDRYKKSPCQSLKIYQGPYLSKHLYQLMIQRLTIWLQKFIKSGHF